MSSKSKVTGEGVETVASTRLRRIRPAPCKEPKHSGERTKHRRSRKREVEKKAASDFERRQRRRESDARCRANLSSGFDFLRSQVEHLQGTQMKMSKETLLYNSIDQIQYLEAVLVLLQQSKEKSSGKAISKPANVLQKIHKKFVSEKDGILEETLTLQGDSSTQPEISTGAGNSSSSSTVQSAKGFVKRQTLKDAPSMGHPPKEDPSLVLTAQRRKSTHKRTLPNILVKKSDENSPSSKKRGPPMTPKASQEVPKTPQRHGGSGGNESDIHQVPGTPVNVVDSLDDNLEMNSSVKHYRIRGQQIKSMTPKGLKMCNNCQIQDSEGSIDLTCHENPEDWKEGLFDDHLHTPRQRKSASQDSYITPHLKKKTLSTPSKSGGRSRKCLFKNACNDVTSPITDGDKSTKSPKRKYSKRATAARTRPWDSVAMKVTSPFQPYSGLYQQRKKFQASTNAAREKATPNTQAGHQGVALGGEGGYQPPSVRVTSSTKNTFITRPKSHDISRNNGLEDGNEECRSSSQDSLSIQEIPSLPEDILNFISRGGIPLFSDPEEPLDLSLNSSRQLYNILGDDYSPLQTSSTSVPFDNCSGEECLFANQDRFNFDPLSQEFPQYNCVSDNHHYNIDGAICSPSQSRMLFPSDTPNERCYLEVPSQAIGMLDRLEQRNVWQGGRNQDITLTQLQRQPIFGNQDSVYESPQWNRTPFSPYLHPCTENEWIDVESSETGGISSAPQDSWDTADFLSSIDSGSRQETLSESSQQSSSSSFTIPYGFQANCAAVRDIEEYQVVPFYHPEE